MDTWDFTFYWRRVAVRDQYGWLWFSPAIQITYRNYDEDIEHLTFFANVAQDSYGWENCAIIEAPSRDDLFIRLPGADYQPNMSSNVSTNME